MKNLTLMTGNANKAVEFGRLLGVDVAHQKLSLPEIQETDVEKVARLKAEAAFARLGTAVFVDDTGLYINAWGSLPGALIAWFLDNVGNQGILRMLDGWEDRSARVVTALGYCDEDGSRVFTGSLNGSIAEVERGADGFGYDAIFVPENSDKTFAEMTSPEKDTVSMRAAAARLLKNYLEN